MKKHFACCLLLWLSLPAHGNQCDSSSSNDPIALGMTTALSGPNQYLGRSMLKGVRTRLGELNEAGGICGRKLVLHVKDDSYDALLAEENAKRLIREHQLVAFIGNVGTPTSELAWKVASDAKVVFYAAYTGAALLRQDPPLPYVFNFRASYDEEMKVIVDAILGQRIPPRRIHFFLQDDSFGSAGFESARRALGARGFHDVENLRVTRYARNSLSVKEALGSLVFQQPKPLAIILVGGYQPSAEYIRFAHTIAPRARFYNLSFPGATELAALLPDVDGRVYITQVVPQCSLDEKVCRNLGNEVALEGYLAAGELVKALQSIPGEITGTSLARALQLSASTRDTDSGANSIAQKESDQVWLAELTRGGIWVPVSMPEPGENSRP